MSPRDVWPLAKARYTNEISSRWTNFWLEPLSTWTFFRADALLNGISVSLLDKIYTFLRWFRRCGFISERIEILTTRWSEFQIEYDFSFLDKTFTMFLRISICVNRAYSCKYCTLVIIGSRQFICYGCLHRRNRILDRNDNSRASTQSLCIGFRKS